LTRSLFDIQSGGTKLTLATEASPPGFSRLVPRVMARPMHHANRKDLVRRKSSRRPAPTKDEGSAVRNPRHPSPRSAWSGRSMTLRFEFSPHRGGTLVVLINELPAGAVARNASGWEMCLDRLARLTPAPDAGRHHFDADAAAFE
jgi:hypothetical protein